MLVDQGHIAAAVLSHQGQSDMIVLIMMTAFEGHLNSNL